MLGSLLMLPLPPTSTLFPYTTLFRSRRRSSTGSSVTSPSASSTRRVPRTSPGVVPATTVHTGPCAPAPQEARAMRSEEHTSELQSHVNLVCRLLLEKKKQKLQNDPCR